MKTITRVKAVTWIGATLGALALTGCESEGPAERAGEKIDNAAEQVGDTVEEATDSAGSTLEKAGDKLEEKTD